MRVTSSHNHSNESHFKSQATLLTSPDPVHGAATLGEAVHGGDPLDVRQSSRGVPQQCAGVVVPGLDEPVRGPHEVLVVSVVEQVAAPHCPGVLQQGVRGVHLAQGVSTQDGHCFPPREPELCLEEV